MPLLLAKNIKTAIFVGQVTYRIYAQVALSKRNRHSVVIYI